MADVVVASQAPYAAEGGHFYDAATGEPRYTIIGANGKERTTTLRDAKKAAAAGTPWYPGVTTVTAQAARFQLERWKAEQLLLAGLTLPRAEGEAESAWIARVWEDSKQQATRAAERGTEIHAEIETCFAGREHLRADLLPWVDSVRNLLEQTFGAQQWRPEKSFASPLGYGGKVDLHSDSVLVDFKGKEGDRAKWKVWPEHWMQLAAYGVGLGLIDGKCRDCAHTWPDHWQGCKQEEAYWENYKNPPEHTFPRTGIIFFDRTEPYCEWHEVKAAELERGWRMFEALLAYWKAANL